MPDLPKRTLGRTGLQVTALGFGALELRGMVAGVGRRQEYFLASKCGYPLDVTKFSPSDGFSVARSRQG